MFGWSTRNSQNGTNKGVPRALVALRRPRVGEPIGVLRNTTTHHSISFVSTTFSILTILLIGSNHWQSYGCHFSISIFSQSYIIVHLFREVLPKKQRIKPNGLKCPCHDPIFGIISFISHLYDMAFPPVVRSCSNISNSLLCRVIFFACCVHASKHF